MFLSLLLILCSLTIVLDAGRPRPLPQMPCCLESLGVKACFRMKARDPERFDKRCKYEADFAILQCCNTCKTNISEFGTRVFAQSYKSKECFDRARGCRKTDCSSSVIAFRICRKTCGYCDVDVYRNASVSTLCPVVG